MHVGIVSDTFENSLKYYSHKLYFVNEKPNPHECPIQSQNVLLSRISNIVYCRDKMFIKTSVDLWPGNEKQDHVNVIKKEK